jgi:hypothetical protein
MARRSPQTVGKRERELAKLVKRERKQEKKAATAAARALQPATLASDIESDERGPGSEDPRVGETG